MDDRFTLYEQWSRFQKIFLFKKRKFFYYFLESSCSFYLGFLFGNIFGTFLTFLRNLVSWDGILFFFLIVFFEFLNFFIYKRIRFRLIGTVSNLKACSANAKRLRWPKGLQGGSRSICVSPQPASLGVFFLKNFQTGILFGFFIDAFKVGS